MIPLVVIHNPHSRSNKKSPWLRERLARRVEPVGQLIVTQNPGELDDAMARLAAEGVSILAINGGDGSNGMTITAMIRAFGDRPLPRLALLRGGTMNTIANGCGIQGTPLSILYSLVHKIQEGAALDLIEKDTLQVEGRFGFLFGNGLIANFLTAYYKDPEPSPISAARLLLRGSLSTVVKGRLAGELFAPIRARVLVDDVEWPAGSYSAMTAATVEQIGLGFKPFFRCDERPGSFHFLGIRARPLALVASLPSIWLGRKASGFAIAETVASRVELHAEQEQTYTMDGDLFRTGSSLCLTTGPRLVLVRG